MSEPADSLVKLDCDPRVLAKILASLLLPLDQFSVDPVPGAPDRDQLMGYGETEDVFRPVNARPRVDDDVCFLAALDLGHDCQVAVLCLTETPEVNPLRSLLRDPGSTDRGPLPVSGLGEEHHGTARVLTGYPETAKLFLVLSLRVGDVARIAVQLLLPDEPVGTVDDDDRGTLPDCRLRDPEYLLSGAREGQSRLNPPSGYFCANGDPEGVRGQRKLVQGVLGYRCLSGASISPDFDYSSGLPSSQQRRVQAQGARPQSHSLRHMVSPT